jgi:hypothetical protein
VEPQAVKIDVDQLPDLSVLLVGMIALLAITSVIARRLRAFRPLVPPDTSSVLVRAEGALTRDTVALWEMSGSRELILRFNEAPHGTLVEV